MTEPATSAGIFGKLAATFLIFCAPLVAFALGTQVVPLDERDPTRDMVRRVMGCFISSAVFALASLLAIHRLAPWVMGAAGELSAGFGVPPWVGLFAVFWTLCVVGALPGWWIVGPFMRWFADRRGKDFAQIVEDARKVLP